VGSEFWIINWDELGEGIVFTVNYFSVNDSLSSLQQQKGHGLWSSVPFYIKIKIEVMPRSGANCEVGHEPIPD
jgi:hypothetical protein